MDDGRAGLRPTPPSPFKPVNLVRVGAKENVSCIDLHALSKRIYEALGPARLSAAFVDGTHHSNYGAYLLAAAVADSMRRIDPTLATFMASSTATIDPEHPPDPGRWQRPSSPPRPHPALPGN